MVNAEILQIGNIIGYILQSIYLAYFIICVKNIKGKRLIFTISILLEYIFLRCIEALDYNVNFDILLGFLMFIIIKLIYKEKGNITDFITYIIALLFLGVISIITSLTIGMNIIGLLVANILPILLTYLFKHKLSNINKFYVKFWNRHNDKKMLKSVTIRGFSSVLTILTFILSHIWLIYGVIIVRR